MYPHLYRMLGNHRDDALELAQEVFVNAAPRGGLRMRLRLPETDIIADE